MMDALTIEAVEAAVARGYPGRRGAVLLVELDGAAPQVDGGLGRGRGDLPRAAAPFEIRAAETRRASGR